MRDTRGEVAVSGRRSRSFLAAKRGGDANCGDGASERRWCVGRREAGLEAGSGVGFGRKRWGEGVWSRGVSLGAWVRGWVYGRHVRLGAGPLFWWIGGSHGRGAFGRIRCEMDPRSSKEPLGRSWVVSMQEDFAGFWMHR